MNFVDPSGKTKKLISDVSYKMFISLFMVESCWDDSSEQFYKDRDEWDKYNLALWWAMLTKYWAEKLAWKVATKIEIPYRTEILKLNIWWGKNSINPIIWNIKKLPNSEIISPIKRWNAPISKIDWWPINIHHEWQNPNWPFTEIHVTEHRKISNNKPWLTKDQRNEFNNFRNEYWRGEWDNWRFK